MITTEQKAALLAFAAYHGRRWKTQLADVYWYNARIWENEAGDKTQGYVLHALRNSHGPAWLSRFKLT